MSKRLAIAVIGIGVAALSLMNGSAFAQSSKFIYVGETSEGTNIYLDTEEIQGTSFKLYSLSSTTIYEMSYYASCGETRLFSRGGTSYSRSSGQILAETEEQEELKFFSNSPAGKAMIYVCRRINARGW